MAYPKELRNKLGISQQAFANLIQCNESQLAMAESGSRSLPTKSSALLAALQLAVIQIASGTTGSSLSNGRAVVWLNRRIRNCEATKLSLLLQQEATENKTVQLQEMLQVADLLNSNPLFASANNAGLQLQVLKRKAVGKLKACQFKLAQLQITIARLETEITKAHELKQGFSG